MMLKTNESISSTVRAPKKDQYLFVRGDVVVGRLWADCCVCAWKDGKQKWPGAEMAMTWTLQECADLEASMCIQQMNAMKKRYRG
jgi:hypothetical protein